MAASWLCKTDKYCDPAYPLVETLWKNRWIKLKNHSEKKQISWNILVIKFCENRMISVIWDVLCDLVLPVQFKKRKKHPLRNVIFSKVPGNILQLY